MEAYRRATQGYPGGLSAYPICRFTHLRGRGWQMHVFPSLLSNFRAKTLSCKTFVVFVSHIPARETGTRLCFQLATLWVRICTLTGKNYPLKQCLFNNKLLNKTFNYLIKLLPLKHLFASYCLAGLIPTRTKLEKAT